MKGAGKVQVLSWLLFLAWAALGVVLVLWGLRGWLAFAESEHQSGFSVFAGGMVVALGFGAWLKLGPKPIPETIGEHDGEVSRDV